jgi:hypothetical protein
MIRGVDLQIPLFGTPLRPSRPLLAHRRATALLRRVDRCRSLFPELEREEIRVGITRSADGIAVLEDMTVRFDLRRRLPTHYVIGHELTHLLQALRLVPHGEVQCDVWTLARSPLFLDEEPCYLEVPAPLRQRWDRYGTRVAALCSEAIRIRSRRRQYLRWLTDRLEELATDSTVPQSLQSVQ